MLQFFILILLFSMDFSCHSQGGTVPSFYIGGQNILNTDTPSSQSYQEPSKACLSYVINSQSASSMLSNVASLALSTHNHQTTPLPLSTQNTQHEAARPPINPATDSSTPTLSFTEAANAKWTEYILEQRNNKRKNKTGTAFKNPASFTYYKAPGQLNSNLTRRKVEVPVQSVYPPKSPSSDKKNIAQKLILFDPTQYNHKSRKWKQASTTIALDNSHRPLPINRTC
jgi:hypothetical protein